MDDISSGLELSVSEFVVFANQTLEYAYPSVIIAGELANFKIRKNKWVYFDLKDEEASLRFFGTVYMVRGVYEDGMMLRVRGSPKLHPLYGFSITVQQIELVGEGTIKRAAKLLEAKLQAEGLFEPARKRPLPYPPSTVGLITSAQSAAYADFIKILGARWGGVDITVIDTQVQGAAAPAQIVQAISAFNQQPQPPEVVVIIRGGDSAEDLQAFSDESVVRAVATSRIPTLVAIGHEIDISLAELAADQRASTPSNAAELLTPDKRQVLAALSHAGAVFERALHNVVDRQRQQLARSKVELQQAALRAVGRAADALGFRRELLGAFNPELPLARGYAIVRKGGAAQVNTEQVTADDIVDITMKDGVITARVTDVERGARG